MNGAWGGGRGLVGKNIENHQDLRTLKRRSKEEGIEMVIYPIRKIKAKNIQQ